MSKETREMVDNLLKSLDIKYRSGEWYRAGDVRKLLHELVDGYNKQADQRIEIAVKQGEVLKAIVNDITDDPTLQAHLLSGGSLKEIRETLGPHIRTVEGEEE